MTKKYEIPCKEFCAGDKKLLWYWDDKEKSASAFPINNLSLYDKHGKEVWNMKDTVGFDEVCTGVRMIDDISFYFVIFMGIGFTIDLRTLTVKKKTMVK